jgi:predicted transcriptional regulator
MEVEFTASEEAQLSRIAHHNGTDAGQLVKEAALKLLRADSQLNEGVQRGIAAADRGDFVESSDVWANVEKILKS